MPLNYGVGWSLARKGLLGACDNGLGIIRMAGLAWDDDRAAAAPCGPARLVGARALSPPRSPGCSWPRAAPRSSWPPTR